MNRIKQIKFDKAIIYTKFLNKETLLIVDSYTNVKFLDIETLKIKQELKIANNHARYSTKVVAFSTTAENFALISPDAKESKLFKTKNRKLVATVWDSVYTYISLKYYFFCRRIYKKFTVTMRFECCVI